MSGVKKNQNSHTKPRQSHGSATDQVQHSKAAAKAIAAPQIKHSKATAKAKAAPLIKHSKAAALSWRKGDGGNALVKQDEVLRL